MADNDDIPFNRNFPLKPGIVEQVRPGVRRILCDNPSPFTFTGTVSYIVGQGKVAIIDPGPNNEAHAQALFDAVRGETVTHILVTHTHRDHSPNTARIKAATGATVYAEGPHRASRPRYESEKHNPESGADRDFAPDVKVAHGETIEGDGFGWKPWRPPATPPIIWPSPGPIATCPSLAITSWAGRPRSWRLRTDRWSTTWPRWSGWRRAARCCTFPATGRRSRKGRATSAS